MAKTTKGGVSKKTINGRVYYYYQWYEDGKRRSRTISEEEAKDLSELAPITNFYSGDKVYSGIELFTGDKLESFIKPVEFWKSRYCLKDLLNYLHSSHPGKVYILYGLRRTGKTTLMLQAISQMKDISSCAFITLGKGASISDLYKLLSSLREKGITNVFIDEATIIDDFIEGSTFLADSYAMTMNVVLSGTDSLGFFLSLHNQLFDRAILSHTTYISFKEFSYVLGINDIDRYIEYGGTLVREGINYHAYVAPAFFDERSSISYVDSSIVHNIQHSLSHYRDGYNFLRLKGVYENDDLTDLINQVIADCNHRFLKHVIERRFKSHDYGSLKQMIMNKPSHPELVSFLDGVDEEKLYRDLMEALEIADAAKGIEQEDIDEMKRYLYVMDVIADTRHINVETGRVSDHVVFSQPGLRYSQCKALIESIFNQEAFQSLSKVESAFLIDTLENDVKGRLLEDIVLLEMGKRGKDVCKATFAYGEYDMVIYDERNNACEVYEIKHSAQRDAFQRRFLQSEEMIKALEKRFGRVINKTVLYRGENAVEEGIAYQNLEEFLRAE